MGTFLERFILTVMAAAVITVAVTNPWSWSDPMRVGSVVVIVGGALLVGVAVERIRKRESANTAAGAGPTASKFSDGGRGGHGGGGNAVGKNSVVVGGRGGRGGSLDAGRGGDGGGGDALGDGGIVYGGDGGDAGRIDGRGGYGGASPLKRLPPETLRAFGLTGNEGFGQGGRGANSAEYDRCLRVLLAISARYTSENPAAPLTPMPGVLMPPLDLVNQRLLEMGESFRVRLIDNETDFLLERTSAK